MHDFTHLAPHVQPPHNFDNVRPKPVQAGEVAEQLIAEYLCFSPEARRGDPPAIEPKLNEIKCQALLAHPSPAEFWHVYTVLKQKLLPLVGYGTRRAALSSPEAFEVARKRILDALSAGREATP